VFRPRKPTPQIRSLRSLSNWLLSIALTLGLTAVAVAIAGPAAVGQEESSGATPKPDLTLEQYQEILPEFLTSFPEDREAIISFEMDVDVLPSTDITIHERITYNTGTRDVRRGIIRDIPKVDLLDNGQQRIYGVSLISVRRDGAEVPYTVEDSGTTLSLRIGDEQRTIQGVHEFEITYSVANGLDLLQPSDLDSDVPPQVSAGDIELYWDFVGDEWTFPVYESRVSIRGPAPALAARCYPDPQYALGCTVDLNGGPEGATTMTAETVGWFELDGYLTGAIAWAPDAFTQLPAPLIMDDPQATQSRQAVRNAPLAGIGTAAALLLPVLVAVALRRRSRGVVSPASPVRYEPPKGLRPAEVQAGLKGTLDSRGFAATLADLAARGHVRLRAEDGGLLSRETLTVTRTGHAAEDLATWESDVLNAILAGRDVAVLGEENPALASAVVRVRTQLSDAARTSGRFNPDGHRPDKPFRLTALIGLLGLVASIALVIMGGETVPTSILVFVTPISIGLIVGGLLGAVITPRRQTKVSANFIAETEGFRRFLDSASAAARRDFAQRAGIHEDALFATYLPYAIVLDLEDTWIDSFRDVDPERLLTYGVSATTWSGVRTLTQHMSSSMASGASMRSSGSGFSSGGRGGGGGGGGGGSSF
jgi:uncharacterized membrane protein YgcG